MTSYKNSPLLERGKLSFLRLFIPNLRENEIKFHMDSMSGSAHEFVFGRWTTIKRVNPVKLKCACITLKPLRGQMRALDQILTRKSYSRQRCALSNGENRKSVAFFLLALFAFKDSGGRWI